MKELWKAIQYNIERVLQSDPAATSWFMVVWTYPHITALFWHFFAHRLYRRGWFTLARRVALHARRVTGIEIHPGAQIGKGLFIDHGMGVVIGETAIVGDNVTLFHGVTLGGTGKDTGKRHPTVRKGALISAHAQVIGPIEIGEKAKVGAGAVVVSDVPSDVTVVGVPAKIVRVHGEKDEPTIHEVEEKREYYLDKLEHAREASHHSSSL